MSKLNYRIHFGRDIEESFRPTSRSNTNPEKQMKVKIGKPQTEEIIRISPTPTMNLTAM